MEVDAFDLSEKAIAKARKLAQEKGVSVNYSVSSIDSWNWENDSYDRCV